MGQKDHVGAGADHILDPGPGVEYLHVAGADRQAGSADGPPAMEEQGENSGHSSAADSPPPDVVEEPEASPSTAPAPDLHPDGGEDGLTPSKNTHQPLCRTQCVDLGTDGPPEPPSELSSELPQDPPAEPTPPSSPCEHPPEPPSSSCPAESAPDANGKEYQAKLDFALKLGYSEETVRLVLSKLGPDTLINDILGELVKLGTSDSEQPTGSLASTSSSSSTTSSCGCSDLPDGQRSDSPCPSDPPCDQDNLRPVVVDGSNVAMR